MRGLIGGRLTPEEILNRGFPKAVRGLSEPEVRAFLKRVADEVAATRDRERTLQEQVNELGERLRNPPPLTEAQLLDTLGEETARVLRSAQSASEDIRSRAEDRAAQIVREAQDEAARLREEAEQVLGARTSEAEEAANRLRAAADEETATQRAEAETETAAARRDAQQEAEETRRNAHAEADAEIEQARQRGREMVVEAKAVRERILTDLARRRASLQKQVEELRTGRQRLLDAYRAVQRSLAETTAALAGGPVGGEVRETLTTEWLDEVAGVAAEPPPIPEPVGEGEPEVAAAEPGSVAEAESGAEAPLVEEAGTAVGEPEPERSGEAGEEAPRRSAGELFKRLRKEAAGGGAVAPGPEPEPTEVATSKTGKGGAHRGVTAVAVAEHPDAALLRVRDAVLEPLAESLSRRAKRALQDEQNELLDVLRKHRGRVTADAVLPDAGLQRSALAGLLRAEVDESYITAATTTTPGEPAPSEAPGELLEELAVVVFGPLRERLAESLDMDADANGDDEVVERVGARYREFKRQQLEAALGDALAAAWAHGVYDALPAGTLLRWVTMAVGACPDADDNALQPTRKGDPFPTGQTCPPAHAGCRCLVAVADE